VKWRDLIAGGLIALAVTIIGGIAVYLVTRPPPSSEELIYTTDQPVVFAAENTEISLISARVSNIGGKASENVAISLRFDGGLQILDKRIQMSSGLAGEFEDQSRSNDSINILVPVMVPGETINISAMLNGITQDLPIINVRSMASLGKEFSAIDQISGRDTNILAKFLSIGVALLSLLAMVWFLKSRYHEVFRDVNNLAFIYIHQGMVKEAKDILAHFMEEKGASTYELLNYGLATGLTGDLELSNKYLTAGEWLATSKRAKGLAEFNRAIIGIANQDFEGARSHLMTAFHLSRRQVANYSDFSVHIQNAVQMDSSVASMVKSRGRES
jgi:hypothetical protein